MPLLTDEERVFLFNKAEFFKGLSKPLIAELISISNVATYPKGSFVTRIGDLTQDFFLVISGLLRVNACSSSGKRITFLRVIPGEPYNMLSPYMDTPRFLEARAIEQTRCLWTRNREFRRFVENHPPFAARILKAVGGALDGANTRILDLMEKSVEERIKRVLSTLHTKSGSPLNITAAEVADIAGTTTESTLRTIAKLRENGVIRTRRGRIWIEDADALKDAEFGDLII